MCNMPKHARIQTTPNTFWKRGLGIELRVGSNKKLDPSFNTNHVNILALNNEDPTLVIINHILMVY